MQKQTKRALLRQGALLTAATTGWLVVSPALAMASPVNRVPKPLGHTRTLTASEMTRIFGARPGVPTQTTRTLSVAADDSSGSPEPWQAPTSTGVSTASGNKLTQHPIVSWTQRGGLPISFSLSHSSIGDTNNTVGKKWTHSFNTYLFLSTSTTDVQAVFGDGRGERFTQNVDGSYSATAGIFDSLVKNSGGTYTLRMKDLTVWTFSAAGWLTSIADKNGNTATLGYNSNNQVTSVTDATGRVLSIAWDTTNKRITSVTDPASRTWDFAYDSSGNLSSVTDPAATIGATRYVTTYSYDGSNRVTQITDRRGKNWTYSYDTSGRLSWEKTPLLHQTSYIYGSTGVTITDPRGNAKVYTYNSAGELSSVKDEANYTESYSYNVNHLKTVGTDKRGKAWSYSYDSRGNMLTATDPLSQQTTWTYNTKDEPLTQTDALNHTLVYTYDSAGNRLTEANALSQTTTYTVGTYGLVTAKQDARNKVTTYSYDANGNLTQVTTPGSKVTGFSYNVLGVPTSKTDAAGRVSTFTLDGLFRKTATTYIETGNATMTESFTYNANDNITAFSDGTGTTSRTYDDAGRLTSETKGSNTVTYTYDGTTTATKGRLISMTDAAGRTVSQTYTVLGQLASVSDTSGSASFTYSARGEEQTTTNANGTTVLKTYDDAGQLSTLINKNSGGTVLSSFAYTYRADGKKATVTENTGDVDTYTYDNAGRLTGESRTGSASFTASYTLDADGNRTSQAIGTATTVFAYDTDDALTSVSSTTGGLNNTYTYNANGDQITRTLNGTAFALAYNSKGELAEITNASSPTKSFRYDAMGRRVERTSGTTTTTFVCAGDVNGGIILNEMQGSTTTASYTYGNGLLAKGSESYLFDGQGSTRQVTDTSGSVTSSSTGDAFGNTVASSGTKPEYGYNAQSGYRDDGDAGLVHIAARYYDAQVGMFITRDTVLTEKPYQYCEHDPANATDPSGHVNKTLQRNGSFLMAEGAVFGGIGGLLELIAGETVAATLGIAAPVAAVIAFIGVPFLAVAAGLEIIGGLTYVIGSF